MRQYIKTEIIKIRRTTIQKLVLIIPIICVLLAAGFCSLGGEDVILFSDVTAANHWGLIWLPAFIAILCGLAVQQEKKSSGYKMIFGSPIKPERVCL